MIRKVYLLVFMCYLGIRIHLTSNYMKLSLKLSVSETQILLSVFYGKNNIIWYTQPLLPMSFLRTYRYQSLDLIPKHRMFSGVYMLFSPLWKYFLFMLWKKTPWLFPSAVIWSVSVQDAGLFNENLQCKNLTFDSSSCYLSLFEDGNCWVVKMSGADED